MALHTYIKKIDLKFIRRLSVPSYELQTVTMADLREMKIQVKKLRGWRGLRMTKLALSLDIVAGGLLQALLCLFLWTSLTWKLIDS